MPICAASRTIPKLVRSPPEDAVLMRFFYRLCEEIVILSEISMIAWDKSFKRPEYFGEWGRNPRER
jgi:hypothetical protein